MFDMIRARRESEKKEERYDLFSQLLDASEAETAEGLPQISDRELVGTLLSLCLDSTSSCPENVAAADLGLDSRQHLHFLTCCEFATTTPKLVMTEHLHVS